MQIAIGMHKGTVRPHAKKQANTGNKASKWI